MGLEAYCDHNSGRFPVLAEQAALSILDLHRIDKARRDVFAAEARAKVAREAWLDARCMPEPERHQLLCAMRLRESEHAMAMAELNRLTKRDRRYA